MSSENNPSDSNSLKAEQPSLLQKLADGFFYSLVGVTVIGSLVMMTKVNDSVQHIRDKRPDYEFPKLEQLLQSIPAFFIILLCHVTIKKILMKTIVPIWLEEKYKEEIYNEKVSIYLFKQFYLTFFSVVGLLIFRQLDFFPYQLGGTGEYRSHMLTGEDIYYYKKPDYFDLFYMINLGWSFFDTYLLFTIPPQSDFPIMLLHHLVTSSLIIFSHLYNYSGIGAVVFFLHYAGDAFGYVVRIFVYVKGPYIIKAICGVGVVLLFIHTRLYVFGIVIHDTWYYLGVQFGVSEYLLVLFMAFLYLLHIIWITLIIKKCIGLLIYKEVEELYKHKKK